VNNKVGAFAEDVDVVCKSDQISVLWVFEQFGLEVNADKTESLTLNTGMS
jgi:hypothetical protein